MPTAFGQATKSSVPFILTASLRWVTLFRERYQLTLSVTRKISRLICEQGFKNEKEARIIVAGANQKGYATSCELLYTNFCERNQFLFCWKRLSKFFVQMLRDMCLLFVKTVVVIIKSTAVPLNTLHKCMVIAWIARTAKDRDVTANANRWFSNKTETSVDDGKGRGKD